MYHHKIKFKFVYNKIKLKFTNVLNVTTQDKIKFVSYKIFSA